MYEFLQYQVKDAMTSNPVTITADTPIKELEQLFEAHDFNGVPVVDDQGRLVGVATKFDVLKAFALNSQNVAPHYEAIMAQPVKTVLTPDPVTIHPDLPLSRLLQKLVEMGTKSFPVVQDGHLVGMIAREDVLQALRRATTHQSPDQEAQP